MDFACARFVASWIVCQLDMRNATQILLNRIPQLPLHALSVIDVILQKSIISSDRIQNGNALLRFGEVEPRDIKGVNRLDKEFKPGFFELTCRVLQIIYKGIVE